MKNIFFVFLLFFASNSFGNTTACIGDKGLVRLENNWSYTGIDDYSSGIFKNIHPSIFKEKFDFDSGEGYHVTTKTIESKMPKKYKLKQITENIYISDSDKPVVYHFSEDKKRMVQTIPDVMGVFIFEYF